MEKEWEIPMEGRQLRGKNEKCVWFSSTDKARLISRHGLLFPTAIAWLPSCILSSDSFIPFLPSFLPLCEECCDAFRVFIPVSHFRPLQNSQNLLHPCVSWISRTLYISVNEISVRVFIPNYIKFSLNTYHDYISWNFAPFSSRGRSIWIFLFLAISEFPFFFVSLTFDLFPFALCSIRC